MEKKIRFCHSRMVSLSGFELRHRHYIGKYSADRFKKWLDETKQSHIED